MSFVRKSKNVKLVNYNSITLYAVLFKIYSMKSLLQHPLKNLLTLFNWEKISPGISFLDFSNSSLICGIRFRENSQHPRMLLSIIYSASYCLLCFLLLLLVLIANFTATNFLVARFYKK